MREFEEASGLTIDTWESSWDIGKAVRAVLDGEAQKIRERLERIKTELQGLVERCDESMKKLPDK